MKISISRRSFVILLILFIITLVFLSLSLFAGFLLNRDSREITFPSSNVDYAKWQLPEGAITRLGKGTINDIKFSPNGTQFAVATTIGVWLYDAKTGKEISLLNGHRVNVLNVAFYGDGKILLGANRRATIWQWNTTTGELLSTIHDIGKRKNLYSSVFSTNGKRLAGVEARHESNVSLMTIGDLESDPNTTFIELDSEAKISSVIALSSDGRLFATAKFEEDGKQIQVWNADTGELVNSFAGDARIIKGLAFSPDGMMLASGDSDETIMLFNIDSNESSVLSKGIYSSSFKLTFSLDGELIASGDDDGNVRILKVYDNDNKLRRLMSQSTFKLKQSGHRGQVTALVFSPDSETLISGSEDGTIRGWNVTSRRQMFVKSGHSVEIDGLAELTDTNNLISMHSLAKQLFSWNMNSGEHQSGTYFFNKNPKAISTNGMTLVIEEWFPFLDDKYILWNRHYNDLI